MSNYIDDVEMLKEYKIIREAFDNIKLDILNKVQEKNLTNNRTNIFDDFFNILDFQILFINQISQTFRGIKEDVGYKEKIINNLIKINKDMCEKMILNYIDKLQRRNAVEKRNSMFAFFKVIGIIFLILLVIFCCTFIWKKIQLRKGSNLTNKSLDFNKFENFSIGNEN